MAWASAYRPASAHGHDIVQRWAARRKLGAPARPPSARISSTRLITRWLTGDLTALSPEDRAFTEALCSAAPKLGQAAGNIRVFADLLRQGDPTALTPWLEAAAATDLSGFVTGLRQDEPAVRAAICWRTNRRQLSTGIANLPYRSQTTRPHGQRRGARRLSGEAGTEGVLDPRAIHRFRWLQPTGHTCFRSGSPHRRDGPSRSVRRSSARHSDGSCHFPQDPPFGRDRRNLRPAREPLPVILARWTAGRCAKLGPASEFLPRADAGDLRPWLRALNLGGTSQVGRTVTDDPYARPSRDEGIDALRVEVLAALGQDT